LQDKKKPWSSLTIRPSINSMCEYAQNLLEEITAAMVSMLNCDAATESRIAGVAAAWPACSW
jgi:hypothetical protein